MGPFSETNGLPAIFLYFLEIAGNPPLSGEALFRTLIASGNSPFWHRFSPPPREHDSARNWANSYSRLPTKRSFSETNGLPKIPLEFWEIADNIPLYDATLFRTLIADANSPIFGIILALSPLT